jgi:hypothetical protein
MASPITDHLIAFYAKLTTLHEHYSQLSTTSLNILYAAALVASMFSLMSINAEPWAYLLCSAVFCLYITITAFLRKYRKISPSSPQNGKNRRA